MEADLCRQPKARQTAGTCVADIASSGPMRNRLRGRVGAVQLTSLAVVGVGLGLMLGFMFMSVIDTVSHDALSRNWPSLSDKLNIHMSGMTAAPSAQSRVSNPG